MPAPVRRVVPAAAPSRASRASGASALAPAARGRDARGRGVCWSIVAIGGAVALATASVGVAGADARLFRPLTADPRESQSHWRMVDYTEDWRYGTDVTDSTSRGGVVQDRTGVAWEVAGGEVFRWTPLERIGRVRGPWIRYQLGVPASIVSRFDGSGTLVNTDYQFGASFDALWRGDYRPDEGVTGFQRAVVTSRLSVFHRSSHLGDEVIAEGSFGRNQTSPPYQGTGLGRPPVKRVDLSYEAVSFVLSIERGNGVSPGTLRAYVGGETKLIVTRPWRIGGVTPPHFRSPVGRAGLEYRSQANAANPGEGALTRLLNQATRAPRFETEWLAAIDLRLAKPYNFASADNPTGETEQWTPHLWTASPYGREFRRYAGSWHALVGLAISSAVARAGRRMAPEWIVALDWYRGYAPDGQLLDQRLRYRPRGYVVPSVTAHF